MREAPISGRGDESGFARVFQDMGADPEAFLMPACIGEVRVKDRSLVQADIDNLKAATESIKA